MIIGQYSDIFPSYKDGVAYVQDSYCRELNKRGHKAYCIAPWYEHFPEDVKHPTILYKSVKLPKEQYRLGLSVFDRKYAKTVSSIPFDLIHSHSPFSAGIASAKLSKKLDIPLVSTFHSQYYDDLVARLHSKTLTRAAINRLIKFYNLCDEVWTVSEKSAETLNSYGYKKEIYVVENGIQRIVVDEKTISNTQAFYNIPNDVPVILFAGQVHSKKNIVSAIHAFDILNKRGFKFHFVIAGDGPQKTEYEELTKKLNLSKHVSFLGNIVDKEYLGALYKLSKLLIVPSYYDTFSLVIREAASNKTPSLTLKNSHAAAQITDGYNGFLSIDDSAKSIADTIVRSIDNSEEVGVNAFNTLVTEWDKIIDVAEKRYINLINKNNN